MSRGSTLTLYKKYDLKMEDEKFNSIVKKYAEYNKKHDYCKEKKPYEEYEKDIPLIMNIKPFRADSKFDKKTQSWIDVRPKKTIELIRQNAVGYVDSRDRRYCEYLMEWDFGSMFDCLVDKYNLAHYNFSDCVMEITPNMAQQMLTAINYILDGEWSDKTERGMNNEFIKTFTEGYQGDSYWKYVYRNKSTNGKCKTFKIKEDGFDITIKCPMDKKNETAEDDNDYSAELNESNEWIEYALDEFRSGLITFLKCDNWDRHDDNDEKNPEGWLGYDSNNNYKYVLTYEYWG